MLDLSDQSGIKVDSKLKDLKWNKKLIYARYVYLKRSFLNIQPMIDIMVILMKYLVFMNVNAVV